MEATLKSHGGGVPLLTESQKEEIYRLYRKDSKRWSRWVLARKYDVSQSTINNVIRAKERGQ